MTEGQPGDGDPGGGGSPERRRWLRGWRALVAGISFLAAIVGLIAGVLALIPEPEPPDPAAIGRFEEDARIGPSSLGAYLADRDLETSNHSADELETQGLRFQLPMILEGLDGSRVAVLWGLYERHCTGNLEPRDEIEGAAFVPDSQRFGVVADVWLPSGWAPPDQYCFKISLSRSGGYLLDFYDYVFRSVAAAPGATKPLLVQPVHAQPQPQFLRLGDGPGVTSGTDGLPPGNLIPALPIAPDDVPSALRAREFRADLTGTDDDATTPPITSTATGATTTVPSTEGGTETAPAATSAD